MNRLLSIPHTHRTSLPPRQKNPLFSDTWTYVWEHGRELMSMFDGEDAWEFTYDANGMRTSRTEYFTGYTYTYVYNGGNLSQMTVGNNTLYFAYDATGTPMTVTYNGTVYYYVTNLQGDVIAILKSDGTPVVTYTYDAWGKPITTESAEDSAESSNLGAHNPLRYRGYVYDQETGLYYLQSRYYNPTWGRFLNADSLVSTGQGLLSNNMFAYCLNNPVIYGDYTGHDAILLLNKDYVGHIGIMAQDDEGRWWHFYWGTSGIGRYMLCAIAISVEPTTWYVEYTGDMSLDAINNSSQYSGDYESNIYFYGDFSDCISDIMNPTGKYHLYAKNCSQVSLGILAEPDTIYQDVLKQAAKKVLPTDAFSIVKNSKLDYFGENSSNAALNFKSSLSRRFKETMR